MLVTSQDYTTPYKHYGNITIPKGTKLTNQTATGKDENVHFVNEFAWIDANYSEIAPLLKHDVIHYGIDVPKEFVIDTTASHEETKADGFNYYAYQLSKITAKSEYMPSFQIRNGDDEGKTNWMKLNDTSATELVKWLCENYTLDLLDCVKG